MEKVLAKLQGSLEFLYRIKPGTDKEDYISIDHGFSTFAVIKDGQWYEKSKMGWWACVSNEKDKDKWQNEFQNLLKELPEDKWMSIVDCHI